MKKLFAFFLIVFITSCKVEQEVELDKRYFRTLEVLHLPALQYDSDNSPPDLRVDLKRRSVNYWEFSTETLNNAGQLPAYLSFPAEILATDEVYEIRIVDEDLNQPADYEIFFWSFQAEEDGENGVIPFFDGNKEIMQLNYNVR